MMLNLFNKINQFYAWWVSSLLSCLPEKWLKFLSDLKSNFDLIITHQRDSVTLMTNQGKILDSIPLSRKAEIDFKNSSFGGKKVGSFSDSEMIRAETLAPDLEPFISPNPGAIDFELDEQKKELNVETLDLITGNATHAHNVISLNIPQNDDPTILLDYEDQTIQLPENNPDSGDDTIIIQNDQGNLLQFDSVNSGARDGTILFCNDAGKIRQVEADDLKSNIPDEIRNRQLGNTSYGDGSNEYLMVAKLLEKYQGGKSCLYFLPDDRTFVLNLTYPIEAIQNIESVLRYDLEKHIPLSFQEIRYFYALNVKSGQNTVDAEVAVIKSEEFDLLNLSLEPFVKGGLFCTTEFFFRKYGKKINFLEHKPEKNWWSIFKISNLLPAFNGILFLLLMTLPFLTLYRGLEELEDKSPQEIGRVKDLVTSLNSSNAESSVGSKLSEQINKAPRSVELLSALSNNINSQAWLTSFSLKNNQIKIKGEADSATSVSDDLNRTGLFERIKFISSIITNPKNGKETFELLLILKI